MTTRHPNRQGSRPWLLAALLAGLILAPAAGRAAEGDQAGTLALRVMLVTSDLSVKPVPKKRFLVVSQDGSGEPATVTTRFDGGVELLLPPGQYRVRSDEPIEFEENAFTWDVEVAITAGEKSILELSNDNAEVKKTAPAVTDGAALYEKYKDGVVKVIADSGHGSGFLVDASGLVMTNHHVVMHADYLAVRLDDEHKHEATLLAQDEKYDVAILRMHPETVRGRPVLELADDAPDRPAVTVGETVLAIGSPLTTETILTSGMVSKVEEEAIYSDVSINPGNSGGPLFNARGQVVGINTFGLQAATGPGVSGITRIHVVRDVLEEARAKIAETEPPGVRRLPVVSTYRFSPEAVREMAVARNPKVKDYHLDAGKIDIHFFTPVIMAAGLVRAEREAEKAAEKRRKKRRKKHASDAEGGGEETDRASDVFYEWQKDSDNFKPVVRIRAFPETKMTFGSAFAVAFTGGGGKFRFKTDFDRMELLIDGKPVEPIHPGRIREVVNVSGSGASMTDIGYWGLYEYPPEAFAAGGEVILRVWQQDVPEPKVLTLPDSLVESIRADMKPYYEAHNASEPTPPAPDPP
jgi:S1-C subfamily serine protease